MWNRGFAPGLETIEPAVAFLSKHFDATEIDFGLISHDHPDSLDKQAVRDLKSRFKDIHWYVPADVGYHMFDKMADLSNVHSMNWGEKKTLTINGKKFDIWCVPAQHYSASQMYNDRLWCGWVVRGPNKRFYFTGDTGYCEREFEKIGRKLGPFDISAICVGHYGTRPYNIYHVSPDQAVQIHKMVRSRRSFAVKWGTYSFTSFVDGFNYFDNTRYLEPKEKLEEEVQKAGLRKDEFTTIPHGRTWTEDS